MINLIQSFVHSLNQLEEFCAQKEEKFALQ